jgi:nucleotide-binding universal stress UspA family protein
MYQRILLVVEANRNRHVVVDRAFATLAMHRSDPQIRVLVLVNSDTSDTLAENPVMYRNRQWFEDLTRPLDLLKIDYDLMVSFSTHFAASILYAARQFKASIIGMPVDDQPTDSELTMLQDAPCPVMFVRPGGSPAQRRSVLMALRPLPDADDRPALNPRILKLARQVADSHQAELHAACGDSQWSKEEIAGQLGLVPDHIHLVEGSADGAIKRIVETTHADLLVLGCRERRGNASLRGGLIDRLLGEVEIDVLVAD